MTTQIPLLFITLGIWLTGNSRLSATIRFPVTIVDPGNNYAAYHNDVIAALQGAGAAWDLILEESGNVSI